MDAKKWQQIASSFSYAPVTNELPQDNREEVKLLKPNQLKEVSNAVPIKNKNNLGIEYNNYGSVPTIQESRCQTETLSTTPCGLQKVLAEMNLTIQKLTKLVDEKSQIIQMQETTITMLEKKLVSLQATPDQVRNNTKIPKDCVATSKSVSSKSKLPALIPVILNRLEDLEKRMDQFSKSLPKKVQLYCEKYISACKFRYDESGEFLLAVETSSQSQPSSLEKKPIWERSPRIKPKINHSSQIRQKNRVTLQENKENLDCCTNERVENYLKHLETIVNDLKIGFVQLLLQKMVQTDSFDSNKAKNSNGLKLNTICSALHNL